MSTLSTLISVVGPATVFQTVCAVAAAYHAASRAKKSPPKKARRTRKPKAVEAPTP